MMEMDKQVIKTLSDTYKVVFNTPEGKNVLNNLKFTFNTEHFPYSDDKGKTDYLNGQKSVIAYIDAMVKYEPSTLELYFTKLMMIGKKIFDNIKKMR